MEFIDPKKDTMTISEPDKILSVQLDSSMFYYDKGYVQVITDYDSVKLLVLRRVTYETVKIGAMGTRSHATSIQGFTNLTTNAGSKQLILNEDLDFKKETIHYLELYNGDKFVANKNGFIKMFESKPHLADYIKQQKINFKKEEDIKKLLAYCVQPGN